jgi:hypothetical protein
MNSAWSNTKLLTMSMGPLREETVIQINTKGPWGLTYINPKDDPRQKSQ